MADIANRLPGRMLVIFVAKHLATPASCSFCHQEPALAEWTAFVPPVDPIPTTDAAAMDAMYESWLREQQGGRLRFVEVTAIGATCLAGQAAKHMQDPTTTAQFLTFFRTQPFPDQLVGALSVEPGLTGMTYPMVVGLPGQLALGAIIAQLNRPLGDFIITEVDVGHGA